MKLHQPVLLEKVIEQLAIKPGGLYVDATFGRGGHAKEILKHLSSEGRLLVCDKDPEAIEVANQLAEVDKRVTVCDASFEQFDSRLAALGMPLKQQVNGLLMDLGVSSPQFDQAERGFSFMQDGPLDMRMNPREGMTAAQWLKQARESDIADVLYHYGEERHARRIARAIVAARSHRPLERTLQLAEVITKAIPHGGMRIHPATRSFQAIRIMINRELDILQEGLKQSMKLLALAGRLVVISFHSLEDRIVKRFMKAQAVATEGIKVRIMGRPLRADAHEIASNRRARSAILRTLERVAIV